MNKFQKVIARILVFTLFFTSLQLNLFPGIQQSTGIPVEASSEVPTTYVPVPGNNENGDTTISSTSLVEAAQNENVVYYYSHNVVIANGGNLFLKKGVRLEIRGNLTIQGTGTLTMPEEAALSIQGNWNINNTNKNNLSGKCLIEVGGNITQTGTNNIHFGGECVVSLNGSQQQQITFNDTEETGRIWTLENKNTSNLPLVFYSPLNFDKYVDNGCGITGYVGTEKAVVVKNRLQFFRYQGIGGWLNKELVIDGNLYIKPTANEVNITQSEEDIVTLKVNGDFKQEGGYFKTFGQKLLVTGNYVQTGGTFEVMGAKARVEIANNMDISGTGVLKMVKEGSVVTVNKNFTMSSSASHAGCLTAGTIEIKGNFLQNCTTAPTEGAGSWPDKISPAMALNFCAANSGVEFPENDIPKHRVILNGTGTQTVEFKSATKLNTDKTLKTRMSQFSILTITQPKHNYKFKNDLSKERIYEKFEDLSYNKDSDKPYILKSSMKQNRTRFGLVCADGNMFAIGGTNNTDTFNDVDMYDSQNDSWYDFLTMKVARKDLAVAQNGANVYVFGGTNASGTLQTTGETFSTTSTSTNYIQNTSLQNISFVARKEHQAAYLDGRIYIMGGSNSTSTLSTLEIYNPATQALVTLPAPKSMNTARKNFGATVALLNGKYVIVAAGGENGSTVLNTVESYEPATNTWTTWPTSSNMKVKRKGFGLSFVCGKLYAYGGVNDQGQYIKSVEVYDDTTKTWSLTDREPSIARGFFGSTAAFNSIFIAGGQNPTVLDTFEQFLPTAMTAVRMKGDKKSINGDFTQDEVDLKFNQSVMDFELSRTYNTQFKDDVNEFLGRGWKFNLQSSVKVLNENSATDSVGEITASLLYIRDNPYGNIVGGIDRGTVISFNKANNKTDGNGKTWYKLNLPGNYYIASWYVREILESKVVEVEYPSGVKGYFTCPAGGVSGNCTKSFGTYEDMYFNATNNTFEMTTKDKTKYLYTKATGDTVYKNTKVTDKFGNVTNIVYSKQTNNNPQIEAQLIDKNSAVIRKVTIKKNSVSNGVYTVEAIDNTNRTITYTINATTNQLTSVVNAVNMTTSYEYYSSTKEPINYSMMRVLKDNKEMTYATYDDSGRIKTLKDSDGNTTTYHYEDIYIDESGETPKVIGNLRRCIVDDKNHETIVTYNVVEKRPIYEVNAEKDIVRYKYEVCTNEADSNSFVDITNLKEGPGFYDNTYSKEAFSKAQHSTRETTTDANRQTTVITKNPMGDIKLVVNPDGTKKKFEYDISNNLTKETCEEENGTVTSSKKYEYDTTKVYLKKVFNDSASTAEDILYYYSGCDTDYAGKNLKGLLMKKETTREGTTKIATEYDYNTAGELTYEKTGSRITYYAHRYGALTAQTNLLIKDKTGATTVKTAILDNPPNNYEKTNIYYTVAKMTPAGNLQIVYHDKNLKAIKTTMKDSGQTKASHSLTTYDKLERKVREVSSEIYNRNPAVADTLTEDCLYYTYYNSGNVATTKDPENYTTTFIYDDAGNIEREIKPDLSEYIYEYDGMDRTARIKFKPKDSTESITLEEYIYDDGTQMANSAPDRATMKRERKFYDNKTYLDTYYYYDYAGRLTKLDDPYKLIENKYYGDGNIKSEKLSEKIVDEYGNTSYKVLALDYFYYNSKGQQEIKLSQKADNSYYVTKNEYYADGLTKYEGVWADPITYQNIGTKPNIATLIGTKKAKVLKYTYNDIDKLESESVYMGNVSPASLSSYTYVEKERYSYEPDGNLSEEIKKYTSTGNKTVERYEYNYLGKPSRKLDIVKKEDIVTDATDTVEAVTGDTTVSALVTTYDYYLDGNIKAVTDPSKDKMEYTYNDSGKLSTTSYSGSTANPGYTCGIKDEEGYDLFSLKSVNDYDWNGNVISTKMVSQYPQYSPKYGGTTRTYNSIDYNYDSRGFLLNTIQKVTDENGNIKDVVNVYQYDLAGRLIAEASPESFKNVQCDHTNCKEQYTIDKAESKNLYSYDFIGRLQTKTFDGVVHEGFYEKTKTFVTKAYQYDARGNVTKEVDGKQYLDASRNGKSVAQIISAAKGKEYSYNMAGNVEKVYTPVEKTKLNEGPILQYTYNGLGDVVKQTQQKGIQSIGTMNIYSVDTNTTSAFNTDGTITYTQTSQYNGTTVNPHATASMTSSWKVDMQGNPVLEKKGTQNGVTRQYNGFGQEKLIDSETDLNESSAQVKNQIKNYYDVDGNLKISKNSLNTYEIYEYDSFANVLSKTVGKKKAGVTKSDNLIIASDLEEVVVNRFTYDVVGNTRFVTDGNGFKTEYIYDSLNRPINTKQRYYNYGLNEYVNKEERKTYDLNGNATIVSEYMKRDSETYENMLSYEKYTYDGLGRVVYKSVDCNKGYGPTLVERLEYNENSDQIYSYDVLLNRVEFIYDDDRRLIETIDQCQNSTKNDYDVAGNICRVTDDEGNITHYYYDALDRLKEIKYVSNKVTGAESAAVSQYTYNTEGNISEIKMGSKVNVTYTYTDSDLVKERWSGYTINTDGTKVGGKKENYYYHADGKVRKTVNSSNNVTTTYDYKPQGWVKSVNTTKDSEYYLKEYTYDGNGNCTNSSISYTQGGSTVTNNTERRYDALGRVYYKSLGEFDGVATYIYDYFYEGLQCEISRYSNGKASTKGFDRSGKIRYVYGMDVSAATSYEQSGAVKTEYKYDDKGRRTQLIYPNKASTSYTYYANDLLNTLTNHLDGYYFRGYFANGIEIEKYVYTYYGNRKMESKKEYYNGNTSPTYSVNYDYDELGRLKKVTQTGNIVEYTYDNSGNRLTETIAANGVTTLKEYTYTDDNLLDYYTSKDDGVLKEKRDYEYDANGNQTYEYLLVENGVDLGVNKKTLAKHEYNILDQVTKTTSKGYVIENTYNAEDQRIKKKVGKFDQNQVLQPVDNFKFVYEYDKVVFETSYSDINNPTWNLHGVNLVSRTVKGNTYYPMYNGHADVTRLINQEGKPVEEYYYDEWGVETKSVKYGDIDLNGKIEDNDTTLLYSYVYSGGTLTDDQKIAADLNGDGNINLLDYSALLRLKSGVDKTVLADKNGDGFVNEKCNIKYAGYEYDAETGLYYLGSRFYDPDIARFIQEDTVTGDPNDPLSLNLYTYCHNEPLMYQDPDGHAIKFYQAGSVIKGAVRGIVDEFSLPKPWELIDSFKSLKELASEIASGNVSSKDLIQLGLSAVFEDFIYVYNNRNVLLDDNKYSDKRVEDFSYHATKALMQTMSMVAGGAGAVLKIKNMISKVKGIKKMKKALDATKSITKTIDRVQEVPSFVSNYIKKAQATVSNAGEVIKDTSKKVTKKVTTKVQKAKTEIKQTAAKVKQSFSTKAVEASTGQKIKTDDLKDFGKINSEKLSDVDVKKSWSNIDQSRGKSSKNSVNSTQNDYSIRHTKRTPYEGDTVDEVARKVLEQTNKKSIRKNKEYGGIIYEKNGRYYATMPVAGSKRSFDGKSKKRAMTQLPDNSKIVGDYHTHGDYSIAGKNDEVIRTGDKLRDSFNSDNFSPADRRSADLGRDNFTEDFRSYLGTPSGQFKVITKNGDDLI